MTLKLKVIWLPYLIIIIYLLLLSLVIIAFDFFSNIIFKDTVIYKLNLAWLSSMILTCKSKVTLKLFAVWFKLPYWITFAYIFDSDDTTNEAEESELINHFNLAVSENNEEQANARRNRNRRLRSQQKKLTLKPEPAFSGLGCRGRSHKKYRRYENGI